MRALIMLAAFILPTFQAVAGTNAEIAAYFKWPAEQRSASPGPRLNMVTAHAWAQSGVARSKALDAQSTAEQAKLEEIVITASDAPGIGVLGIIKYPSGATMLGALRPNGTGLGVYTPDENSPLEQFHGEIDNTSGSTPRLGTGVYKFKNGDEFSGSHVHAEGYIIGVYSSPGRSKQFAGEIDPSDIPWIPVLGALTSKNGKLLAVIGAKY